ncbi:kinase-like domain-containing protein [Favolaschia claudopus]|uniref:Kinase-like domain-containing protein n=1 Tax=Favolaschia claudopus TaxID=2862362 RepID=A0AAV9Z568_9AGAR
MLKGAYHILINTQLGQGHGGTVYLAIGPERRTIACKVIKRDRGDSAIFREISILLAVKHPNLIELLDTAQDELNVYLFFPKYDTSLQDHLATQILLSDHAARRIVWQILDGIRYLHGLGISSRCSQPDNILVCTRWSTQNPTICIADLGMATYQAHSGANIYGTVSFMPPEAIASFVDPTLSYEFQVADMWSVGVVAFMLISGFHPFHSIYLHHTQAKISAGLLLFQPWLSITSGNYLVAELCHLDPLYRITATLALQHSWFALHI